MAIGPTATVQYVDYDPRLTAPSYAGNRTRQFRPETSLYNFKAANTLKLRTAVGFARAGTGLCRIQFIGDSVTEGYGATPGTSDYVKALRGLLGRTGCSVNSVIRPIQGSTLDSRLTNVGWTIGSAIFPIAQVSGAGSTITLAIDAPGTVLELIIGANTAAFTYSIDGGAAVAIVPNGSSAMQTLTVTGLANTTHSVVITSVAGGANYLSGIGIRNTTGIILENDGVSGSKASDWVTNAWYAGTAALFPSNPNCVVIEFGLNEYLAATQITGPVFQANLTTLITAAKTAGANVILVASHRPDDTGWSTYVSNIYDVADAQDVPLIDLCDAFSTYAAWTALNLSGIGLHFNATGYAIKAALLTSALLQLPTSSIAPLVAQRPSSTSTDNLIECRNELGKPLSYFDTAGLLNATAIRPGALNPYNGLSDLKITGRQTTPGIPATNTWVANDAFVDSVGNVSLCTAGGTPGTWIGGGWRLAGFWLAASALVTSPAIAIAAFDELQIVIRIPSLSATDFPAIRFNGDTGTNYRSDYINRALSSGVTFTDVAQASGTMAKLTGLTSAAQRQITTTVNNLLGSTKLGTVVSSFGSAAAGTQPTGLDLCGDIEWINTTAQITSVTLLTFGGTATMPIGAGMQIYGRNFA